MAEDPARPLNGRAPRHSRRAVSLLLSVALLLLANCERKRSRVEPDLSSSVDLRPTPPPPARRGMVWVPPGALIAGSPVDQIPRAADREMRGEQVVLSGFLIDKYPYPNEPGAIPMTNVSQSAAEGLCAEQEKRLCSELEWERACKGLNNSNFAYGNVYRADVCEGAGAAGLRPSGLFVGCKSDLGVYDLHGGVWEWTSSTWGRGTTSPAVAVRGGDGIPSELVGRCAYAEPRAPDRELGSVGFRCCAGEANRAEVTIRVSHGHALTLVPRWERELEAQVIAQLPVTATRELRLDARQSTRRFELDRAWLWRPIANEELSVFGGCAGFGRSPACGVLVVRVRLGRAELISWAGSGGWAPALAVAPDAKLAFVSGADERGAFTRTLAYQWGKLRVGPKERLARRKRKQRRR